MRRSSAAFTCGMMHRWFRAGLGRRPSRRSRCGAESSSLDGRLRTFSMSLLLIFQWLVHAPEFTWVRDSKWGFAVVEMVHLVALAGLGGAVLLADLGVLGVGLRRRDLTRQLSPVFVWSLAGMVLSGALLIAAEPMKCYYHPAFRLKMVLLGLAVVFAFTVRRRAVESKLAAVLSLSLWLSVGLAGRAIGFL